MVLHSSLNTQLPFIQEGVLWVEVVVSFPQTTTTHSDPALEGREGVYHWRGQKWAGLSNREQCAGRPRALTCTMKSSAAQSEDDSHCGWIVKGLEDCMKEDCGKSRAGADNESRKCAKQGPGPDGTPALGQGQPRHMSSVRASVLPGPYPLPQLYIFPLCGSRQKHRWEIYGFKRNG